MKRGGSTPSKLWITSDLILEKKIDFIIKLLSFGNIATYPVLEASYNTTYTIYPIFIMMHTPSSSQIKIGQTQSYG